MDEKIENLINDLWFTLAWYVEGYPFDENHKAKHKILIKKAQEMLGIPETIEEIKKHLDERAKNSNTPL